jgi:hypothetical protein
MPRNVDAVALFFIVVIVLVSGYFIDHGPWCVAKGLRIGVIDEHGFMVVAPRIPRTPRPPAPPAIPAPSEMVRLPAMPQLPRF